MLLVRSQQAEIIVLLPIYMDATTRRRYEVKNMQSGFAYTVSDV